MEGKAHLITTIKKSIQIITKNERSTTATKAVGKIAATLAPSYVKRETRKIYEIGVIFDTNAVAVFIFCLFLFGL